MGSLKDASAFAHKQVQAGQHTLIKSTCNNCGDSRILSAQDDSLERWERDHKCIGTSGR
jgi:hypothetical protein